jgi:acylphosphatase
MPTEAVEATVTGVDQKVGFRALVMKQAIEYNLAGLARNDANEVVHFTLQGDEQRIGLALAAGVSPQSCSRFEPPGLPAVCPTRVLDSHECPLLVLSPACR